MFDEMDTSRAPQAHLHQNGRSPGIDVDMLPPEVQQQINGFRQSDSKRENFMMELLAKVQELDAKYQQNLSDLEAANLSRRAYQQECGRLTTEKQELERARDVGSFAVALIDGDGAIFTDTLLASGNSGGSDAAHRLAVELKKHLQQKYNESFRDWPLVVQLFLNMEGLGRKLASLGLLSHPEEIRGFARSFSLNQSLFSIIDVGEGKERADHKIRENLRLYVNNIQCKAIVFGPCSDTGYLTTLDTYKHDPHYRNKISLLETTPAHPSFRKLNFDIFQLPGVFRADHLPSVAAKPVPLHNTSSLPVQAAVPASASTTNVPAQQRLISPPQTISSAPAVKKSKQPIAQPANPLTPTTESVPSSVSSPSPVVSKAPTPVQSSTFAKIGAQAAQDPKTPISIKPSAATKPSDRKYILLNNDEYRLDEPFPKLDRSYTEKLNERTARNGKFCNHYHIKGSCETAYCPYKHGPRLKNGDLMALKIKARSIKCGSGGWCRDPECYYGHVCQSQLSHKDGYCSYNGCYFSDMHRIDLKPAKKIFDDGTEVTL